jgi:hypothetical protein
MRTSKALAVASFLLALSAGLGAQEERSVEDVVEEVEALQNYMPDEQEQQEFADEADTAEDPELTTEADGDAKTASEKSDDLAERLQQRSVESEAQQRAEQKGVESDEAKEIIEGVVESQSQSTEDAEQNDVDIMALDVSNSIDDAVNQAGYVKWGGDLRTGYYWSRDEFRDGADEEKDDDFRARFRLEGQWNVTDSLRLTSRLAYLCSTASCDPNTTIKTDRIDGNSIEGGTATIDEFYLHWFRTERFNMAVGRMQTRFITRGGVFAKSLDRNNSNNANINWTDGIHATFNPGYGRGWRLNWISEYNNEDQTSSVRRKPLDYSTTGSQFSHFVSLENNQRWGYIIQRGIDISYLPDALLVDGDPNGRRDDYWAAVGRTAARIPLGDGLQRLQVATEVGYAPDTPTREALDPNAVGVDTDVGGVAWNVSASVMDFLPNHSVGLLYGRTDPGWLISPQYVNNEKQVELRYVWRPDPSIMLDARIRYREDLKRLTGFTERQSTTDIFLRATIRYSVDNLLNVMSFGGIFQ